MIGRILSRVFDAWSGYRIAQHYRREILLLNERVRELEDARAGEQGLRVKLFEPAESDPQTNVRPLFRD